MTVALIGNNTDILDTIKKYLLEHFAYIFSCESVSIFEEHDINIQKYQHDLVLYDFPKDQNNAEIIRKIIRSKSYIFPIVSENADIINLLKQNDIRYLKKPINFEELHFFVDSYYTFKSKELEIKQIIKELKLTAPKRRIAIPQERQILMIPVNEILYIKADINYCKIFMPDKKNILVSKTLKNFEQQLINNPEFYRIHQSYLINLNYIQKVIKTKLLQVEMSNGEILSISKSKRTEFLNLILK